MEQTKDKILEKWKRNAMDWYQDQKSTQLGYVERTDNIAEDRGVEQELKFVRELKEIIVSSNLDRKSIYLSVLASMEAELEKGVSPGKLPVFISNLSKKDSVRAQLNLLTKKYAVGGKSFYYLWNLGE